MSDDISSFTISPINHEISTGSTVELTFTIVMASSKKITDGYIRLYINNSNITDIMISNIIDTSVLTYNYTFQTPGIFNIYAEIYGTIGPAGASGADPKG